MKNLLPFLMIIGLLINCKSGIDDTLIRGKWKAAAFVENGVPSDVDLSNVYFQFNENGSYEYFGTVQQEEAGRYYVLGRMLHTTDTTAAKAFEKSVKIKMLTTDSLYFQMNAAGKPQIFQLYRVD